MENKTLSETNTAQQPDGEDCSSAPVPILTPAANELPSERLTKLKIAPCEKETNDNGHMTRDDLINAGNVDQVPDVNLSLPEGTGKHIDECGSTTIAGNGGGGGITGSVVSASPMKLLVSIKKSVELTKTNDEGHDDKSLVKNSKPKAPAPLRLNFSGRGEGTVAAETNNQTPLYVVEPVRRSGKDPLAPKQGKKLKALRNEMNSRKMNTNSTQMQLITAVMNVDGDTIDPTNTNKVMLLVQQQQPPQSSARLTPAGETDLVKSSPIADTKGVGLPRGNSPGITMAQMAFARNARSSTPISREFLALQRSVNESKVLSKFVTDTSVVKIRKRRKSGMSPNKSFDAMRWQGGAAVRRSSFEELDDNALLICEPEQQKEKQRKNMPLVTSVGGAAEAEEECSNDNHADVDSESTGDTGRMRSTRRSRSKSTTEAKFKEWQVEERASTKRPNMRSENYEFVQKQMEFLSRVRQQSVDGNDTTHDLDDMDEQSLGGSSSMMGIESDLMLSNNESGAVSGLGSKTNSMLCNFGGLTRSLYNQIVNNNSMNEAATVAVAAPAVSGGDVNETSINKTNTDEGDFGAVNPENSLKMRLKGIWEPPPKEGWDSFCWKCNECGELIPCSKCIRCFHATCLKANSSRLDSNWICPECVCIENVLNGAKRSRRNELSMDLLSQLLCFALKRMKNVKGYDKALLLDDDTTKYGKYLVNPITFVSLQQKIEKKTFRCAEEFVNETKWMLHNSLILTLGTTNSKEVVLSKAILKVCRQEANEIETCPECYLNANTRADWFVDVCAQPHLLLWAKLKGFPYWPAKAMNTGQGSLVNVRFFGEHDRAYVPVKDCFLYSIQDPNTQTGKRSARELADCIKEVEVHIEKIKVKIGNFKYAPYKTPYDPAEELQQLEMMIPGIAEYMKRQSAVLTAKPPLQYKIVKTADNHLSIVKKSIYTTESSNDSDALSVQMAAAAAAQPNRQNGDQPNAGGGGGGSGTYITPSAPAANSSSSGSIISIIKPKVTTKYEVISKTKSDDSNSSKVSAVILKRKSLANEMRKTDTSDFSPPAIKQHKLELPIEAANKSPASEVIKNDSERIVAPAVSEVEERPIQKDIVENNKSAQTLVVENLVRNKQGVTIKKIVKTPPAVVIAEAAPAVVNAIPTTATAAVVPDVEPPKKDVVADVPAKTPAAHTDKPDNVIKGLIPFVEIKEEITSDSEEVPETHDSVPDKLTAIDNRTTAPAPTATPIAIVTPTATTIAVSKTTNQQALLPLAAVKIEPLSDEEDEVEEFTTTATKTIEHSPSADALIPVHVNANLADATPLNEGVRVVGDTTIQKITNKNITTLHAATGADSEARAFAGYASNTTVITHIAPAVGSAKRSAGRGVPYGPLPAAATQLAVSKQQQITTSSISTTTSSSNNTSLVTVACAPMAPATEGRTPHHLNQHQQQHLAHHQSSARQVSQRARKSFPNRSPPGTPPAMDYKNPNVSLNNLPTNNGKHSFSKPNMVSIPVDTTIISRSSVNSTVPVPPLTAVSKSLPATAGAAVSGLGGGGCVTLNVDASLASTVSSTLSSSALVTNTIATTISNISSGSSTPTVTVSDTLFYGNVTSRSTPPPLAGLSTLPPTAVTIHSTLSGVTSAATIAISAAAAGGGGGLKSSTIFSSAGEMAGNVSSITTSSAALPESGHANNMLASVVTPTLASAITDVICRGPPKMIARPSGPLQSEGLNLFPSQAGPVCRTLVENAHKLTDFFISVMEDTMCEMSVGEEPSLQAKITLLTMELERTKQAYEHEMADLKRTSDLMICEMRKSMEAEKTRVANDIRKQCEMERLRSVEETKKKQWCAHCGRQAQFYCCWNTSYCDYPCQQLHWSRHVLTCAQTRPVTASTEAAAECGAVKSPAMTTTATLNVAGKGGELIIANSPPDRNHSNMRTLITSVAPTSLSSPKVHYEKSLANSRREKAYDTTVNSGGKSSITVAMPGRVAEVLQLPSNTYLRAVPAGSNSVMANHNSGKGSATTYTLPMQMPVVQHFNIPLPLTTSVSTSSPYSAPFAIMPRCTSWGIRPTNSGNIALSSNGLTTTTATPLMGGSVNFGHHNLQQALNQQLNNQARLLATSNSNCSNNSNPTLMTIGGGNNNKGSTIGRLSNAALQSMDGASNALCGGGVGLTGTGSGSIGSMRSKNKM